MTRKEAIEELKAILEMQYENVPLSKAALEMAISSLETDEAYQLEYERTTKNDLGVDCISRQAVIDLMMQKWGENFSGDDAMQESIDAIKQLPSVTPQEPRWIPVSERLPENETYVLVTIGIPGRQPHARSGWYQDGFFHNDNGDCWRATDIEVKAWMPLSEPYKADRSVGNGND